MSRLLRYLLYFKNSSCPPSVFDIEDESQAKYVTNSIVNILAMVLNNYNFRYI